MFPIAGTLCQRFWLLSWSMFPQLVMMKVEAGMCFVLGPLTKKTLNKNQKKILKKSMFWAFLELILFEFGGPRRLRFEPGVGIIMKTTSTKVLMKTRMWNLWDFLMKHFHRPSFSSSKSVIDSCFWWPKKKYTELPCSFCDCLGNESRTNWVDTSPAYCFGGPKSALDWIDVGITAIIVQALSSNRYYQPRYHPKKVFW